MGKSILLAVCLLCFQFVYGQEMKCINLHAKIEQVIDLEGKSAADIYKIAHRWIAKSFHNKDKIIQVEVENEVITGRGYESGVIKMTAIDYAALSYAFTIDVKEGKLRLTVESMIGVTGDGGTYTIEVYCVKPDCTFRTNKQSQNVKQSIELFFKKIVNDLNEIVNDKGW